MRDDVRDAGDDDDASFASIEDALERAATPSWNASASATSLDDESLDELLRAIDARLATTNDGAEKYVKVPVRAIERLRLAYGEAPDADEARARALERDALARATRANEVAREIARDVLNAEDVVEREMKSRLGKAGWGMEAARERAAMDLMLVVHARRRARDAARGEGGEGEVESLRAKLYEAERAARESELVARSKVSKAFERLTDLERAKKDADAAADEERERAAKLERELERVKASCEETSDALQAANIKVSVLTAQVAALADEPTSPSKAKKKGTANKAKSTKPSDASVDVAMVNSMLASANEKLKRETEAHEAAKRATASLEEEIKRLKPLAQMTEAMKEDLACAVAEANETKSNAENWKKLVDSKEKSSEVNERKLREALTRLNTELHEAKQKVRALEVANEDAVRTGTMLQQQAAEAGERIARSLRSRLDEVNDEMSELKRREAVAAAEGHAASEAIRRAAKFEEELKRAKHRLADAEMALVDSESAVAALQFQLDLSGESTYHDDSSARRETRLRNELEETLALAAKSSAEIERLGDVVKNLDDDLTMAREVVKRLTEENNSLIDRVDAAEKKNEIHTLLGATSAKHEDLDKLQTTASKVDLIVAENQRLVSECKAAHTALKTAEDTARTAKSALASEREEFEVWRRKAREIIDSKDREIDRIRAREGAKQPPPAATSTALLKRKGGAEDDASYIKAVLLQFLGEEEWEVQQNLLPTVIALCGGTSEDLRRIQANRANLEPTFVHSTEVAIAKSLEQSALTVAATANSFTESIGLGRLFASA